MSNTTSSSGGIGLFGLTFVALMVLKLTGYIAISWWWVTAPLWGPLALALSIGLIVFLIAGIIEYSNRR